MGRSAAKPLQGLGVGTRDAVGGGADTVTVGAASDVVAHGSARCFLHRDALGGGPFPEGRLLFLSESKRHRHRPMVSD